MIRDLFEAIGASLLFGVACVVAVGLLIWSCSIWYTHDMYSYETTIKVEGEPDKVMPRFCNPRVDDGIVHVDCGREADFVYPAGKVQLIHRKKGER